MANPKVEILVSALDKASGTFDKVAKNAQKQAVKAESVFKRASRGLKTFSSGAKAVSRGLTKYVTAPILAVGAAALGAAKKTGEYADNVIHTAQKVGMSTKSYQELRYALSAVGLEQSDTDRALGRLNQRMGKAMDGNKKYSEAFKAIGVSLKDSSGHAKKADQVFMETIDALHGIKDPAEQSAKASEIFGTNMARKLMPVIKGGTKELNKNRNAAHKMGAVMSGKALNDSQKFKLAMDDLKEKADGLKHQVGAKLAPVLTDKLIPAIEDKVLPAIEKMGDWVVKAINWFSELSPKTKKFIGIVTGIAVALGPVIGVVGAFAGALGALLTPAGAVVAGIIALAAVAAVVIQNWGPIKGFFKKLWSKVTGFFDDSIKKVKNVIHNIFGPLVDWIEKTWGKIKGFFSKTTKKISGSVSKNWNKIKNKTSSAFSGAKNLATKAWGSLKKGVGKTSKLLTDVVKSRWKNLKNNTSTIYHGAKNVATTTWNGLKKGVSKASDLTKKGVSKAWTATKNTTSNLYKKARDKASSMWSSLKSRVTNHSNTAKKNIGSAWSKMRSNTSSLYTKARNKASSLFSSLKSRVTKHATTTGSKVRGAWSTLKSRTSTMFESIRKKAVEKMGKIVSWAKKMPGKIGRGIKSMAGKAASGAKHAAIRVARGFARGLNKVIGGANHVLDFIHVKHIPKVPIPKYKKGTKAHPGGPALVNDGGGDELIRTPDGKMGIAPGRNTLVNLPKNSEVLPHKETKQLLNGIPAYKKGIGTKLKEMASNVFSYFKNPGKLLNKMYKKLGAFLPKMPGVAGDIAKGGFKKVKSGIASWIKKKISSFGFGGGGKVSGSLKSWIAKAIAVTGVPASWASGLATIAMHESGGRTGPSTINKWDSNWRRGTPSMGVMQTTMPTFDAFKVPGLGGIMDPVANIAAAINYIKHKYKNPYNTPGLRSLARGGPYIGYARGGIVNRRQFAEVAEEGPEGIIPLAFKRRRRALQLWARIGQRIGAFNRFAVPDIGGAGRTSNHVDYRAIGQAIAQEIERLLGDLTVQFPDRLTLLVDGKEVTAAIAEPMERELSDRRSDALYVRGIK